MKTLKEILSSPVPHTLTGTFGGALIINGISVWKKEGAFVGVALIGVGVATILVSIWFEHKERKNRSPMPA